MIKIARLTIKCDESKDMGTVLNNALSETGLTMDDINIKSDDYSSNTHFGNWVLTPVLDNDASQKLAEFMGFELDMKTTILEESDLYKFKHGQKVQVKFLSELCFPVNQEGKIHNISYSDKKISILKKRARKMGWVFRVGDRVELNVI